MRCLIVLMLLLSSSAFAATVEMDDYMDPCDGKGAETCFATAFAAAGTNGTVLFEGGTTYTATAFTPILQDGLTLESTGTGKAIITKSNEISTTLTANANTGQNVLEVVDASVFLEGWRITPVLTGGSGGHDDTEEAPCVIDTIVANTITCKSNLGVSGEPNNYLADDLVVSAAVIFQINAADDVTIQNLIIDGNKDGNDTTSSWSLHTDVLTVRVSAEDLPLRLTIQNVEFRNAQGNSITPLFAEDSLFADNTFTDLNLAAIHSSSSDRMVFTRNTTLRTNSKYISGEHSEGAFTISLATDDMVVTNNIFQESASCGFGYWVFGQDTTNRGLVFTGNSVIDSGCAFDVRFAPGQEPPILDINMVVTGNTFDSSGIFWVHSLVDNEATDWEISGNTFRDSNVQLDYLSTPGEFTDNLLVGGPDLTPDEMFGKTTVTGTISGNTLWATDSKCYRTSDCSAAGAVKSQVWGAQ